MGERDNGETCFFCSRLPFNLNFTNTVEQVMLNVDSERFSSRTSFQLEEEVLDTSEP